MNIQIADTTMAGEVLHQISIAIANERTCGEEIIRQRVINEVEDYNAKLGERFTGLVQPTDSEVVLNGFKMKKVKAIDPEKQVFIALDAFKKNGFFLLIDDNQVTDLKQEILLSKDSTIHFLKLTPLVGG